MDNILPQIPQNVGHIHKFNLKHFFIKRTKRIPYKQSVTSISRLETSVIGSPSIHRPKSRPKRQANEIASEDNTQNQVLNMSDIIPSRYDNVYISKRLCAQWLNQYRYCVKTAKRLYSKRQSLPELKLNKRDHICNCSTKMNNRGNRYINLLRHQMVNRQSNRVNKIPLHICSPNLREIADDKSKSPTLLNLMKRLLNTSKCKPDEVSNLHVYNDLKLQSKILNVYNKYAHIE